MSHQPIVFLCMALNAAGAERVMLDTARWLSEEGYSVHIVAIERGGELSRELTNAIKVINLDSPRLLFSIWRLACYLKHEQPKVVVASFEHAHFILFFARLLARTNTRIIARIGMPVSLVFRNYLRIRDKILSIIAPFIYKQFDGIIAVSNGLADDFSRTIGIPRASVTVIENPKDRFLIQKRAEDDSSLPALPPPILLAAGRIRRQKGFDVLLQAFAEYRKKNEGTLVILGKGGERKYLENLARSLGIADNVLMPGVSENPYAWMKHADVFVLPSRWEGMPNVVAEAMVLGVPVIATDCCYGPRELLDLETDYSKKFSDIEYAKYGILVTPNDPHALSVALMSLLGSAELQSHYASQSLVRAREFDMEKRIADYKTVLGVF